MATSNLVISVGDEQSRTRDDADLDQVLHPGLFYSRPADVVADELLTLDERRAILSSWASDACAVESNPPLRKSPFASAPVTFDEIMDALVQLDRMKPASAVDKHSSRRADAYLKQVPTVVQD